MPAVSPDPTREPRTTVEAVPLAPPWHTAILIAVIVAVAATGTLFRPAGGPSVAPPPSAAARILVVYLPMVIVQWGLAVYVCRVARPHSVLGRLLGERWTSLRRATVDLSLALVGWVLIQASELAWTRLSSQGAPTAVLALLPHGWAERLAWVVVSVSAGFCEEVVYRGYLQTQLTAFTRHPVVAIVVQAALFGVAHGEQGARAVVRVALYGLAFGALARWRRSLWPGIVCHAWTDVASGLLR